MSKITIFKIGLAGGIYKLLTILFVVSVAHTHIVFFRRMVMITMQNFGAFGFNPNTFSGVLSGCLWGFVAGFIQFGAIALIFNILSTKNIVTKTWSKWFRSSKQ
jgi:hypothetical protein